MKSLHKKIFFLFSITLIIGSNSIGQKKILTAAEKSFAKGEYYTAAKYYEKYLDELEISLQNANAPYSVNRLKGEKGFVNFKKRNSILYKIADCYRLHNNYASAKTYYEELVELGDDTTLPLTRYYYAVCLTALDQPAQAEKQLKQFLKFNGEDDAYGEKAKEQLKLVQSYILQKKNGSPKYKVTKLTTIATTKGSTYAPAIYKNGFAFTGTVFDSVAFKAQKNPYKNQLFTASNLNATKESFASIKFDSSANTSYNYAAAAFTADSSTMYFTQWHLKDTVKVAAIYVSKIHNGRWSYPEKLNEQINVPNYNSQDPFITKDGKYLYYSSNRPGGLGQYDIWVAPLTDFSTATSSVNLGTAVNTAEDERAPYYHAFSKSLIFASRGLSGFGGFDLFKSKGQFIHWEKPVNLGYPINSTRDDIYFCSPNTYMPTKDALISSDRSSDCCLELFKIDQSADKKYVKGTVVECETNSPLQGAVVSLKNNLTNKVDRQVITGASGSYSFQLIDNTPITISIAINKGYDTIPPILMPAILSDSIYTDSIKLAQVCLLKKQVEEPVEVEVDSAKVAVDILKGKALPINFEYERFDLLPASIPALDAFVAILQKDPNKKMEIGGHTDGKGAVDYNLSLSIKRSQACFDYFIKKGIDPARLTIRAYGKCCPLVPETIDGKDNPAARFENRRVECKLLF